MAIVDKLIATCAEKSKFVVLALPAPRLLSVKTNDTKLGARLKQDVHLTAVVGVAIEDVGTLGHSTLARGNFLTKRTNLLTLLQYKYKKIGNCSHCKLRYLCSCSNGIRCRDINCLAGHNVEQVKSFFGELFPVWSSPHISNSLCDNWE